MSTILDNKNLQGTIIIKNDVPVFSNIAKGLLGIHENDDKQDKKIETLENFIERINEVLSGICFCSKRIAFDEFVRDYYDEDEIYSMVIKGSGSIYSVPYGTVCFHKSNIFFYDISNLHYIIDKNIIPISLITFPTNFGETFNIKRSNGDIQKGKFVKNSSLKISSTRGGVYAFIKFFDENSKDEMEKHTKFEELLELNNVNSFEIEIPRINFNDYKIPPKYKYLDESLIKTIIDHYNSKIKVIIGNFIEHIKFKNFSEENTKYVINI